MSSDSDEWVKFPRCKGLRCFFLLHKPGKFCLLYWNSALVCPSQVRCCGKWRFLNPQKSEEQIGEERLAPFAGICLRCTIKTEQFLMEFEVYSRAARYIVEKGCIDSISVLHPDLM